MTTTTAHTMGTASRFRTYKAFLDTLAQLRYVRLYPVTWGTSPAVYRTQLRGTQARGFTCVHCDRLSGEDDHAFVPVGHVIDTPECGQLFRHIICPRGDQP
ncbi:MAG: hypothetical protein GEV10_09730 [Streptosporangiales bacterium]|nr:hypothetical protein [Streptosporangiales bacterium]